MSSEKNKPRKVNKIITRRGIYLENAFFAGRVSTAEGDGFDEDAGTGGAGPGVRGQAGPSLPITPAMVGHKVLPDVPEQDRKIE